MPLPWESQPGWQPKAVNDIIASSAYANSLIEGSPAYPPGTGRKVEEIIGHEAKLVTGNLGHRRPATGRHHDVFPRQDTATRVDGVRIGEVAPGGDVEDAFLHQIALVNAVQPVDIGLALGHESGPVVAPHRDVEAVVAGVVQGVGQAGGIEGDLLRYAAHVDTGAAEGRGFDERHPGAVFRGALGSRKPAAAPPDGDEVELLRHTAGSGWVCPTVYQASRLGPDGVFR